MTAAQATTSIAEYGPWNPGILSQLPSRLRPLATIHRPENVFKTYEQVRELHDLTGLDFEELVVFRPERLVVHELLIRVTGELSVPDGSDVDDLGVSFRRMTHTILTKHIAPHMPEIVSAYQDVERRLAALIDAELSDVLGPAPTSDVPVPAPAARWKAPFGFLRRHAHERESVPQSGEHGNREEFLLDSWARKAQSPSSDPLDVAAYQALIRVVSAVQAKFGRIWGDQTLLGSIATGIACNQYGTETVSRLVDSWFREAAQAEGYALLPFQKQPVVINTKGASASGKSTMRPYQKRLAAEIGLDWQQIALISPDIWRRYLLDFGSLGEHYKYAGMFTGDELAIIDAKLDRYLGRKGERREIPHILVDRFRFDSFAPEIDEATSTLVTRFADIVYLFFMITPPHLTVERAWQRGLRVGRYKAVDDLLAHNVEAFTGMPDFFFTWAMRKKKRVHYEFLDNSVPCGERPRTIAYGWNRDMTILDVNCILDIERYRRINVNARNPDDVYPDPCDMAPECNTQFLERCVRLLMTVSFADRETGQFYARIESGRLTWTDPGILEKAMADRDTRTGILSVAPDVLAASWSCEARGREPPGSGKVDLRHILGQCGGIVAG